MALPILAGLAGGAGNAGVTADTTGLRVICEEVARIGCQIEATRAAYTVATGAVVASVGDGSTRITVGFPAAGIVGTARAHTVGAGLSGVAWPTRTAVLSARRWVATEFARKIGTVNAARTAAAIYTDAIRALIATGRIIRLSVAGVCCARDAGLAQTRFGCLAHATAISRFAAGACLGAAEAAFA